MQQSNAFRLPVTAFQNYPLFYGPGDIGGPMCISNGYRWNVPVVTYGFDASFVKFFGSNGVAEVEKAIQVLNDLPAASSIVATNYAYNTVETNAEAEADSLFDLKSMTMSILLEQLGLASPAKAVFVLQSWDSLFTNFDGAPDPGTNITVIMRNYDPLTLNASDQINGLEYGWQPRGYFALGINEAFVIPFPLGFASAAQEPFPSPLASCALPAGTIYTGLTADDVGGLRFLYSTNTIRYEMVSDGVSGAGTNASNWINGAWRPGVDKVTFIPQPQNPVSGLFLPLTNSYTDTYMTNGIVAKQQLQRVVTQPDFLFSAGDTEPDRPAVVPYVRSGTSNWINNADGNGNTSSSGPGTISPPIKITFTTLGKFTGFSGTNLLQDASDGSAYWASFDGSSNAPVVYPDIQQSPTNLLVRLWFLSSADNISFPAGTKTEFNLSAPAGTPVILQTSTNLTDWAAVVTNQVNGSIWTVLTEPNNVARFYRTILQ